MMSFITNGYIFTIEEDNANNILLEKIHSEYNGNVISAIKNFILFLHKERIQYITIYDSKLRDRYKDILLYIYKNANNTERWLYNMASFVYDGDVLRCKIY